jgi:prolyl-tRNA editing enzyme YbaK/EbsC (Cys-tRNA(Pro) deacylase)
MTDRPETLTEALARHGLKHKPASFGRREVFEVATGRVVGKVCAVGAWQIVHTMEDGLERQWRCNRFGQRCCEVMR